MSLVLLLLGVSYIFLVILFFFVLHALTFTSWITLILTSSLDGKMIQCLNVITRNSQLLGFLPLIIQLTIGPILFVIPSYPSHGNLLTFLYWQLYLINPPIAAYCTYYAGKQLLQILLKSNTGVLSPQNKLQREQAIQRVQMFVNKAMKVIIGLIIMLFFTYWPFLRSKITYQMPIVMVAPLIVTAGEILLLVPPSQSQFFDD